MIRYLLLGISFLLVLDFLSAQIPHKDELVRITNVNNISQMNNISNPLSGSLIFVTENKLMYQFDGSVWQSFGRPWHTTGNQCELDHFLGTTNDQDLPFKTNNIERMIIKDNGKVGIGTSNPEARFQVGESDQYKVDILTFNNTNSTFVGNNYHFVYVDDNLSTAGVIYSTQEIQYNGTPSSPKIVSEYTLRITDFNLLTAFTIMARLNDSAPWVTLDSQTNVNWPADYFLGFTFNNTIAYEDYKIVFNSINHIQTEAAQLIELEFLECLNIEPAFSVVDIGNVGVNINNPEQKLHVVGDILANAHQTPDYVFESYVNGVSESNSSYHRTSLKDVELFLKKNKHLPNVPSAKEIDKQGGNILNRASELNLEKIEELYIHIFDLNARIKELEQLIVEESIQ